LEEITKEWLADLLVPTDPVEMSNVYSPETMTEIARPRKIKKTKEVHDLDNATVNTDSISAEEGGDGREIDGT
jgi:hypothetical protein